jgi:hypothetical protein
MQTSLYLWRCKTQHLLPPVLEYYKPSGARIKASFGRVAFLPVLYTLGLGFEVKPAMQAGFRTVAGCTLLLTVHTVQGCRLSLLQGRRSAVVLAHAIH